MEFSPGERFSYSNGGYILLGVVIEELTGMKYQDFVEQQIFRPTGMERSGFFSMDRLPENTALGYVEEEAGWRTNIYNLPIIGASDGGAYTTAQDVATCWNSFWKHEIIAADLVELFTRPFIKAGDEDEHTYYGHGIWIYDEPETAGNTIPAAMRGYLSNRSCIAQEDYWSLCSQTPPMEHGRYCGILMPF